ncbi:MAG: hypothetical protein SXA11_06625 [Cyanobacteriota bacterium]|nr:hypothetical protein [Cyanobacteriota bacterium]
MKQYHNLHLIPPPLLAEILIGLGIFLAIAPLIPKDYSFANNSENTENIIGNGRR